MQIGKQNRLGKVYPPTAGPEASIARPYPPDQFGEEKENQA
jgi:hypothetical protein